MKISLGFSPCPNDTFIFEALVNKRIDTGDLTFEVFIEDVESLNERALRGDLMVSKLSFHASYAAEDRYLLLPSGAAMGFGCGPLLIASRLMSEAEVNTSTIALPGKYTTASLLLSYAYPEATKKRQMLFSEIEDAVSGGLTDAGVIIHENRFTYESKGLLKIADLGEYWENKTRLPVPLGGIFIRKDISCGLFAAITGLIRQSVSKAWDSPETAMPYILSHAGIADETIVQQHINTYVNEYTLDIGEKGRKASSLLREIYLSAKQADAF